MIKLLVIAWRNLWRNKRRTLITTISVFFAVVISTIITSIQEGSYNKFIQYAVEYYSGHIQIQHKEFHNSKSLTHSIDNIPYFNRIKNIENVKAITKRLSCHALASAKGLSLPVYVLGIVPEREDKMTSYSRRIEKGDYLLKNSNDIIIGNELARILKLDLNDTIKFSGQGFNNEFVMGEFRISGIIDFPSHEFNKSLVYMHLNKCRKLFNAPNKLTSVAITCYNNDIDKVVNTININVGHRFRVIRWNEIQKSLLHVIKADRASGTFISFILFLVISFGLFSTIMMMIQERRKEFSVMIALGMKKSKLMITVMAETLFISCLGTISGILACIPLLWHYGQTPIILSEEKARLMAEIGLEPIIHFSFEIDIFLKQAFAIFLISILLSFYPIYRIKNIKLKSNIHN